MRTPVTTVRGRQTARRGRPHPQERVAVMQICDSLDAGGMERVAVNLANALPRDRYVSHLCTTRRDGALEGVVAPDVLRLRLERKSTLDVQEFRRLVQYIRESRIALLHAHGPSLFIAAAASAFAPHPAVIWHDHFGAHETETRIPWLYRVPARRLSGVIAVSEALAAWTVEELHVDPVRVKFIKNFVAEPSASLVVPPLPGAPGKRLVCVANLRPQKDHRNLLAAMKLVIRAVPKAHLILLGGSVDAGHTERLKAFMDNDGLAGHVSWLGSRDDVQAILKGCDVGVLGSASEGLPLALIEYGMAGLPAVATSVGQCAEVLEEGRAGLLVPPGSPQALADAIVSLLRSPDLRKRLSRRFATRVREMYSVRKNLDEICELYESALRSRPRQPDPSKPK
ncbi:MAG: glycosyltransferase family 4 protein [Bacteroidota bacterium]